MHASSDRHRACSMVPQLITVAEGVDELRQCQQRASKYVVIDPTKAGSPFFQILDDVTTNYIGNPCLGLVLVRFW